jgi:putative DNA primase/helicase
MEDRKLEQLLFYAKHGYPIFPIHWVSEGGCSCSGRVKNCKPGKHPLTKHGFYDATTESEQIERWHKQWPRANWGMRTGDLESGGSGNFVVDIDQRSGGFETWEQLRVDHPEPLETVTVATGGGGQHLWFINPYGVKIKSDDGVLGPGVDIKGDGGYVLIPPSATEREYKFELKPGDVQVSQPPRWILQNLNGHMGGKIVKNAPVRERMGEEIHQGERHSALTSYAGALRNAGLTEDEIRASLLTIRDSRFADGDHPITDEEIDAVVEWVFKKQRDYAFSDLGNAERFLAMHSGDVRYCFEWERWLVWDGQRWAVDKNADLTRRAHQTIRAIYSEAGSVHDEERRKNLVRHALKSESRAKIENMIYTSRPYVPVSIEELDRCPMLLNAKNGTVDLTTGELLPHDKGKMITKLVDIDYDPDAKCPHWEEFINLVAGGDNALAYFIQVAVGYTLSGLTDESALFFLYGDGANGKTTFTEAIRRMMGDYAQRIDIEALLQSWGNSNVATPHVANMAGARFVLASEIPENRKLNESLIKDLTGGDSMTARYLHENPFTFTPVHKLWIFGNHQPKVSGRDLGIWRRLKVIPFVVTSPEGIRRPMSAVLDMFDTEMPGILAWAVRGCLFWQGANLADAEPQSVRDATKEYKSEQDVFQQFLDENTESHPDYSVDKKHFYTTWRNWCEDMGEIQARRRSQKWVTRQLTKRDEYNLGGDGNSLIKGLRVKT